MSRNGNPRLQLAVAPRAAPRPTPSALEAAVRERAEVADIIGPELDVLFCGINPGRWSGALGHHFAHPGNRFWKALFLAGLTPEQLDPPDEASLLRYGLGVTNLVARTTAAAAELDPEELRRGAAALERKVRRFRPQMVAFLGIGTYRTAYGLPGARPGRQEERVGGAAVWVVPNPSGLQATYGLDGVVAELRSLRRAAGRREASGHGDPA